MDGTGNTLTGRDGAGPDTGTDARPDVSTGRAVRRLARSGALAGNTAGLAPGYVQANLAVLPAALAEEFALFCRRNPQSCPLLGSTAPGDPRLPALGDDLDLRTDLPRYRVWRHGELVEEPGDLLRHWRDDLVGFAIGCSFTFEAALVAAGLVPRHVECGHNVPMFRTRRDTAPAGRFRGPLVVSMRPMLPADAARAAAITAEYPDMHGAPVHVGDPAALGIDDLGRPDYGEPSALRPGEVPVFWACGVTPQAVLAAVRPDFAVTHAPGCMLLTDRRDGEYRRPALHPAHPAAGTPLASPGSDAAPLAPGAR